MNHKDSLQKDAQFSLTAEQASYLRWCCRRGLLELDVILSRFLDHHTQWSYDQLQNFKELLETPDPILFDWLVTELSPLPEFRQVVAMILQESSLV